MFRIRINNEFIDLENETDLSFIFENQLFSSDIKLSRTIEFTIFNTPKNAAIFNFANNVEFDGSFVRRSHNAELWFSGGIIKGLIYITNFNDNKYSATFVYGDLLKFKEIKDAGIIKNYLNLQDSILTSESGIIKVGGGYPPYFPDLPYDFAFYNYKSNVQASEKMAGKINMFPSVKLYYLLQKCAEHFNINLSFPEYDFEYYAGNTVIILNKMQIASNVAITNIQGDSLTDFTISGDAEINTYFSKSNLNFYFYEQYTDSYGTVRYRIVNKALKCLTAKVPMLITFNNDFYFAIQKSNSALKNFGTVNSPRFTIQSGDSVYINKGESFQFILTNYYTFVPKLFGNDYYTSVNLTTTLNNINFVAKCEDAIDLQYGDYFPLNENLPDLTFIDLLKIFANLTSTAIIWNEETQTIEFFRYDFDFSNQLDLTDNLISLNSVNRYLPDFAQENNIICDSEEYVSNSFKFKKTYRIVNENLEKEKEFYKIPLNDGNKQIFDNYENIFVDDFEKQNDGTFKVKAKKSTIAKRNNSYSQKLAPLSDFYVEYPTYNNNFLNLLEQSTIVEAKVRMYLFQFFQLNEKTIIRINNTSYTIITAKYSNNNVTLTLAKLR
ncbi:MAG TPA: hypothetical protein PLB74_02210 [Candidatus Paceibacterota bacterium]|nr:hypothetical protein [Candidatus Paceibacterota bacterium]